MGLACKKTSKVADNSIKIAIQNYKSEAKYRINELIGYRNSVEKQFSGNTKEDKTVLKHYNRLYELMEKQLMEIGKLTNYDPVYVKIKYNQWFDIFQRRYGSHKLVLSSRTNVVDGKKIIDASKYIAKLMNLQKTRFGKGFIPEIERELLPPHIFTMRSDYVGIIHSYIKNVNSMVDESRRRSNPYKSAFQNIYTMLDSGISNALGLLNNKFGYDVTMVDKNMDVDDIIDYGYGVKNITTIDNEPIIFLGTTESNGILKHDVIFRRTKERKLIDYEDIDTLDLAKAVNNKYKYELVDEIMNGQTRYVVWSDTPTTEEKEEIKKILTKWELTQKIRESIDSTDKMIRDVHVGTIGGHKVMFVMIKNSNYIEGNRIKEAYRAFIISHETPEGEKVYYYKSSDKSKRISVKELGLKDGFYRANEFRNFGVNYTMDYERGWYFGNNAFNSYMKVQPNDIILNAPEAAFETSRGAPDQRLEYRGIFTAVNELRSVYAKIRNELKSMSEKEQKNIEYWFGDNGKRIKNVLSRFPEFTKNKGSNITIEDINRFLSDIFNIESNVYYDSEGIPHGLNSFFEGMNGDYVTVSYRPEDLNIMIDKEINNIKSDIDSINNNDSIDTKVKNMLINKLNNNLKQLEITRIIMSKADEIYPSLLDEYDVNTGNTLKLDQRNVYAKRRSQWTDPSMRIKDEPNFKEYLDNIFYNFEKNRVMSMALKMIDILSQQGLNYKSVIEYAINRTKAATMSSKVEGRILGKNISYESLARVFSKITGNEFRAQDAEKIIRFISGTVSSAILGVYSSLGNNTQAINNIAYYGHALWKKSRQILNTENEKLRAKWNAIIDNTGALESLLMFTDVVADASGLTAWSDAGFWDIRHVIPFIPPIPRKAIFQLMGMIKTGRKVFLDKGIPEIDAALNRMEEARINNNRDILKRIEELKNKAGIKANTRYMKILDKEEKRLHGELDKRDVRLLRELYLKLILSAKNSKEFKIAKARFLMINDRVSDTRLKRMLGYKLGYLWNLKGIDKYATMTKSEERMTKETIIAALLDADSRGFLGSSTKLKVIKDANGNVITDNNGNPVQVYERFLSPTAVRIARNSVDNIMFRMSQQYLGDAFQGAGKAIMLYKGYQLNQLLYDSQAMGALFGSSESTPETMARLAKAIMYITDPTKKYDPSNSKLDHVAIRAARALVMRSMLTMISVAMESVPYIKWLMYTSAGNRLFGVTARGGESILFGIPLRLMLNILIWASAGDDYNIFEHDIGIGDLIRLFLPVVFTLPIAAGIKLIKLFD